MLSHRVEVPLPGMTGQTETFEYYGPDGQRWKTVLKRNGSVAKTVIFAGDYERATRGDTVTHLYYIAGDEGLCGIYVKQFKGNTVLKNGMYCIHADHLGSLAIITDAGGNVKQKCTFDAWGSRTFITKDPTLIFDRGYTGHEHLPEFGLINMNGRMYDPVVGRFLSPDPYVQMPEFSQSFNRYSYALNNPLLYIDPTGEFFFTALLGPVGAIIDAACWGAVFGGASYTASVAFSDGGFKNWNWGDFGRSAGIGALSGAVTFGVGQMFGPVGSMGIGGELGRAFTHGVMNGYIAGVTGGDPVSAFAAGIGVMTAGLNHMQSSLTRLPEKGRHIFKNEEEAYQYMWEASHKGGYAYKEHAAYVLKNGKVVLLPADQNTTRESHTFYKLLTTNRDGTYTLKHMGKITGYTHTHPGSTAMNISVTDRAFMNRFPNMTFKTIANGGIIYQVWSNGIYKQIGTVRK